MNVDIQSLSQVLQASISPVALVSGVGLLILSQTNRLGRVMDRLRAVVEQRRHLASTDPHLDRQISILHQRARILRGAVRAASISVLLASLLVLLLFTTILFGAHLEFFTIGLFAASLLALIHSLVMFILDLNLSLQAMQEGLQR